MDNKKIVLFDDMTLADLLRDIYEARNQTRILLTDAINAFRKKIKDPDSAAYIGAVVADLFDAVVKNDEHLIKLATVVQRLESLNKGKEDNSLLSAKEKRQLMENAKAESTKIKEEADSVRETVNRATEKLEKSRMN